MELESAAVYPDQEVSHTVPVEFRYAVVQATYMWPNLRHMNVPIPVGYEITTLNEALFYRILWLRGCIQIPPRTRPPPTSSPTSSSGVPPPPYHPGKSTSSSPSICKDDDWRAQTEDPPYRPPQMEARVHELTPPPPPPPPPMDDKYRHSLKKVPPQKRKYETICFIWTQANSKYKPGESMLSEEDLNVAGPNCANVHNHYMVLNAHGAENITVA